MSGDATSEHPAAFNSPADVMRYAIALARRGTGFVEPNPQVGAVLVDDSLRLISTGYHQKFGGPHAEVHALEAAGNRAAGQTLYVTLEPCCHFGKTPPCTQAVIRAGVRRVVVGLSDPFPQVAGGGISTLREAGIEVKVGLLADEVTRLNAPFITLVTLHRPYIQAKWAMSCDGKLAAHTGTSQWITNEASRRVVHQLRGRMDAIVVGSHTALIDKPLLTARPPGPRIATRVVVDSTLQLPLDSPLVQSRDVAPVLIFTTAAADPQRSAALQSAGVEVVVSGTESATSPRIDLLAMLAELGRRQMTNVLVEGGSELLGSLFDRQLIDYAHVFMAPKLIGGQGAKSPIGGVGKERPPELPSLEPVQVEVLDGDVYLHGPIVRH